eukprot:338086-Prymnesium_polylepis.1
MLRILENHCDRTLETTPRDFAGIFKISRTPSSCDARRRRRRAGARTRGETDERHRRPPPQPLCAFVGRLPVRVGDTTRLSLSSALVRAVGTRLSG